MAKPREGHLFTAAPFHLEATVRVLQRRAWNRVDLWEGDEAYVRVIHSTQGPVLVKAWNAGALDTPDLRYAILAGRHSLAVHTRIRAALTRILGLDTDPGALERLARVEKSLATAARALRGMRPPRFPTLFESFASIIPFQQLSIDAGLSILSRLIDRFAEHLEYEGRRYFAFPTPSAVSAAPIDELRACGLSQKKAQTLQRIARAIQTGALTEYMLVRSTTREALQQLVQLPGVGPWTAGLVLLRGLGRTDVFPSGDSGAARSLRKLLPIDERSSVEETVAAFGDVQGYLYFCCLGASLLEKGLIREATKT